MVLKIKQAKQQAKIQPKQMHINVERSNALWVDKVISSPYIGSLTDTSWLVISHKSTNIRCKQNRNYYCTYVF